jgi:hypothetical protein
LIGEPGEPGDVGGSGLFGSAVCGAATEAEAKRNPAAMAAKRGGSRIMSISISAESLTALDERIYNLRPARATLRVCVELEKPRRALADDAE